MSKQEVLDAILSGGAVAVIRLADPVRLKNVLAAISAGGVKSLEITMTVPNAVNVIEEVAGTADEDVLVGAGTVTDAETAQAVIAAGAEFVVSPILNPEVIAVAQKHDVPVMPGCYSPTEIFAGWKAGADVIKVFPATSLGPRFFKDIHGPFPDIRMMPTGGVSVENAGEWIKAGACAVGIGTDLLDKKLIEAEDYAALTERAKKLVAGIASARGK